MDLPVRKITDEEFNTMKDIQLNCVEVRRNDENTIKNKKVDYGLYATCLLKAGTIIGEYAGVYTKLDKSKFDKNNDGQPTFSGVEGDYNFYIGNDYVVQAEFMGNMTRFINTKYENSDCVFIYGKYEEDPDDAPPRGFVIVMHDIKQDTEITVDYGKNYKLP